MLGRWTRCNFGSLAFWIVKFCCPFRSLLSRLPIYRSTELAPSFGGFDEKRKRQNMLWKAVNDSAYIECERDKEGVNSLQIFRGFCWGWLLTLSKFAHSVYTSGLFFAKASHVSVPFLARRVNLRSGGLPWLTGSCFVHSSDSCTNITTRFLPSLLHSKSNPHFFRVDTWTCADSKHIRSWTANIFNRSSRCERRKVAE